MGISKSKRVISSIFAVATIWSILLGFTTNAEAQVGIHSYKQVVDFITEVANKYPKNAQLFDLGANDQGDVIKGIAIGNGPTHNLVVATHHGNEFGSTGLALGFALALADQPIADQTVYVIPVLNISGFNADNREENGVDPNRDYPGPCKTGPSHKLKSTLLLAQFIDKMNIVASSTLHTYMPGVLYPWGISTQETSTPYDDLFISLSKAATQDSQYEVGNSTAALYPADGCYEDYAFWKHGIWSLLWEVGYSHNPSDNDVQKIIDVNVPGLRRFYEQAPKARADHHDFTGKCDALRAYDLRID